MKLTSGQLKEASAHVAYEIWMLAGTLRELQIAIHRGAKTYRESISYCAHLESFLIHARGLIDLLRKNKKDKDVLALCYIDAGNERLQKMQRSIETVYQECEWKAWIDKSVAHITFARSELNNVPRNLYSIARGIQKALDEFLQVVNPRLVGDDFGNSCAQLQCVLNNRGGESGAGCSSIIPFSKTTQVSTASTYGQYSTWNLDAPPEV